MKELLKKLCDMPCISGYEWQSPAVNTIIEEFSKYCDDVRVDKANNIVALKKGKSDGIKIMFAAHMDEIGLMVTGVDKLGLVKFTTLGGFDQRTLICQEVMIHSSENIYGVIGMIPPHITPLNKRNKAVRMDDMGIDTGYSKEDIEKIIKPGDRISILRKSCDLQGDFVTGKSLDDMAGVTALCDAMRRLKDFNHDANIYFTATASEESHAYGGARIAAFDVEPDIAIAVDVGFAKAPEQSEHDSIEMGKGASVGIGPNMNRKVFERLKKAAKDNGINYQVDVLPGMSGTDAYGMQIVHSGVATGLLSIPLRYMHTSVETIKMEDITSTARHIAAFVAELNNDPFMPF